MEESKNIIKSMSIFDMIFTVMFTLSILGIQILTDSTFISLICSVLGVLYVFLVRKGHKYCMLFGGLQALIYCIISFKSKIYGDFMLNTYNILFMTYAYLQWGKNSDKQGLKMRSLHRDNWIKIILGMIAAYATLVIILSKTDGFNIYLDALTTTLSMTGLSLTANRYKEAWHMWIWTNVTSIMLWLTLFNNGNQNAPIMIIMFTCYFINSLLGLIEWNKNK